MRTNSLVLSIVTGFAAGVLLGTFAFEMLPKARDFAGLALAIASFVIGFGLVYGLDLFVNRGAVAGDRADQKPEVDRIHRRHPPRGSEISVLAGGASAEELIEGLSIGVGLAIDPGLGVMVGLAVVIDNVSEALSIGHLTRAEFHGRRVARRVLGWTGLIGASLFVSAVAGWVFLRNLPDAALGALLAAGAGGMFYLTVTDLAPKAEEYQFEQSAAIAIAAGFLLIFGVADVL
jgi:ZIP family zinc transporter